MRGWSAKVVAFAGFLLSTTAWAGEAELLYVADPHCGPCLLFEREIAPIYPKTDEGRRVPIRRIPHGKPAPKPFEFVGQPKVAPTFVLVLSGRELGRFEGYSSDELFWMNLTVLVRHLDAIQTRSAKDVR